MVAKDKLNTKNAITWCPGCPNFMILEASKRAMGNLIDKRKFKQNDFCITTDIGCNSKIFDYLNLSGIYCLHGRALPTGIGIKLGNPKLKVLTFAGDGAVYSEGMEHFIHAFRYNPNMVLIVHDNQSFSLTTGQQTPTSQLGYKSKDNYLGEQFLPLNPIKLALASGATFVARVHAKDLAKMQEIFEKALLHNGFAFVEVLQDCLIFNADTKSRDDNVYYIDNNFDKSKAEDLADQWDYSLKEGKIPCGIIYQEKKPTMEEVFYAKK